jgi:antibiotic biosynthesis monooxygenase (ABM) superfamily enzyme
MPDLQDPPVIVEIRRRVRPDARAAFERDLKALIQDALSVGGVESATVYGPDGSAAEPEYRVVVKFARDSQWRAWQQSDRLKTWYAQLRPHLAADPVVTEVTGLEAWFTLPGERAMRPPPPRWKMAIIIWLAVFACGALLSRALEPFTAGWHPLLLRLVISGLMVLALTYLVLPVTVRVLDRWLHPRR